MGLDNNSTDLGVDKPVSMEDSKLDTKVEMRRYTFILEKAQMDKLKQVAIKRDTTMTKLVDVLLKTFLAQENV